MALIFEDVMNATNSDELNNLISQLDTLLYNGYLLKTHTVDNWRQLANTLNQPDVNQYKKNYEDKINEWLRSVADILVNSFNEKHLYFHFINTKKGLSFTSSDPLAHLNDAFDRHLFALEEIILRLEEKQNLSVRQKIAEKEYQSDILYSITYSDHTREIKLNNIVLKKPDFNSENDNCFNFICQNAGRPIGIAELEEATGSKLNKRLAHIVRDLGFKKELKDIFFPVVTKDQVMFVNPITKQYALKHDLPAINFTKIGRKSKSE